MRPLVLRDLEPLATSSGAYAFAVLFGLLWGSFANVCIYRWPPSEEFPRGRSVVLPGSHCFACQAPIRWYDNTPMLSWLWLRGRCRSCKAPFSPRYLVVEAVMGLLFGLAWWATVSVGVLFEPLDDRLIRFVVYAAFCFVMVVISFIDLDHKLILDKVTLPSIVIFYGLGLLLGRSWADGLIGATIGYVLPWSIGEIYFLISDREGLGLGDSKLLAVIGALLGTQGVVASLFGGALVGSVIGILVLIRTPPAGDADAGDAARPPAAARAPVTGVVLAIIAVLSTVVSTVMAVLGSFEGALGGAVIAVLALVLSRRQQAGAPVREDAPTPDGAPRVDAASAPDRGLAGGELVARVLAVVAGGSVLCAVMAAMLGWWGLALGGAGLGVALLLVAGRLKGEGVPEGEAEGEAEAVSEEAPSLMRTELPFGPFLALAAVFYLFAEPWIQLHFRLPGG